MKTNNNAIVGILNNPATSENSHSAGMVHIVSKLFDADIITENDNWNEYEKLIIYHGPNFKSGSYNIIGGINEAVMLRSNKLYCNINKAFSLDGFQLKDFSIKRKLKLYDDVKDIDIIEMPKKNNMVIGDSHSISVWPNDHYGIIRNDGKTLFGYLKNPIDLSQYQHTILYFGNIDIRFHLGRQQNPIGATKDLFNRYFDYASKYDATITKLLPIEDISRKIPGTGLYKGQPYFGSWELRNELKDLANEMIELSGISFLSWPKSFCDENGKLSFDVMEPKQSVHIRPKFYIRNLVKQQLTLLWNQNM